MRSGFTRTATIAADGSMFGVQPPGDEHKQHPDGGGNQTICQPRKVNWLISLGCEGLGGGHTEQPAGDGEQPDQERHNRAHATQ